MAAVKLTIDVKIRHIWWRRKIRSDGDRMTNLAYSSQELSQQNTKNEFRNLKYASSAKRSEN